MNDLPASEKKNYHKDRYIIKRILYIELKFECKIFL